MNAIVILIDSLSKSHLGAYGREESVTPNIDKLAAKSWRFDNHFVGSLPCMPARREIFTGRQDFLWRPWGFLEPFDDRLPKMLQQRGYVTGLVTDHYHYWEDAAHGYMEAFDSVKMIRGHEIDFWKPPLPEDAPLPSWVKAIEKYRPGQGRRYYSNVKDFQSEEDFFTPRVINESIDWLWQVAGKSAFFLQVECFGLHEPFHLPEPYKSKYQDQSVDDSDFTCWPPYQDPEALREFFANTTEEELRFIQSQQLGKLNMVDKWLGKLLDTFDQLNLWDDTMIILTTDHGHDIGERQAFGKQYPHYDSHANIPLLVWHPNYPSQGNSIEALTQTVDLHATILDGLIGQSENVHSKSILPLISGQQRKLKEGALYGTFGEGLCCTDGEWTLFLSGDKAKPLNLYSTYPPVRQHFLMTPSQGVIQQENWESGYFIPGVSIPQWKAPVKQGKYIFGNMLFDRKSDPKMTTNLYDEKPQQVERLKKLALSLINEQGAPPEQLERLGLE